MYVDLLQLYEALVVYVTVSYLVMNSVGILSVYINYKPWDEWMSERRGGMAEISESWEMICEVTAERTINVSDGRNFA